MDALLALVAAGFNEMDLTGYETEDEEEEEQA
jgi:hypothetical protein